MIDATDLKLDKAFKDNVIKFYAKAVGEKAWTNLHKVKLGAYAPNGNFYIRVPAAYRDNVGEAYFTEFDDSGSGRCINSKVANTRKTVWIGHPPHDKTLWHVFAEASDPEINPVSSQSGVPNHSDYHTLRNVGHNGAQTVGVVGSDLVLIDDRQMWQLGIFPYSGFQARINGGWLNYGGKLQYWDGSTGLTDQTSNVPAGSGDAAWVLVERDAAGTMTYTKGTEFKWATTNNQTSYIPQGADNTAQWALLVRNGDTSFTYACIWNLSVARQVQGAPQTAISAAANTSGPGLYRVDTTAGAVTLTLDTDDVVAGREITIKDTGNGGTNNVTIATEGAETIDGAATQTISTNYGYMRLCSDGTNWDIIG